MIRGDRPVEIEYTVHWGVRQLDQGGGTRTKSFSGNREKFALQISTALQVSSG